MRRYRPEDLLKIVAEKERRKRAWLQERIAEAQAKAQAEERRQTFQGWLQEVSPTFTWTWPHLAYYIGQLERISRGEIRKLLVSMPPRHGKSECGTVRYPVHRLEANPELRIVQAAYNQVMANKFSRKSRRLAQGRIALSTERSAVDDWETQAGGGIRAVGLGGGITGQGFELLLIDDPVKSREEAESEAFRERCWDWYRDDLYTRQEPGAAIVLTMTRWHVDDLAGRILDSEDGPNWTVINFPAIAEEGENDPLGRAPGEALCPARYDVEELLDRKMVLGELGFGSLFQGRPRPAEGGRFKRAWFRYWQDQPETGHYRLLHHDRDPELVLPATCVVFATVDSAISEKTQADYTVISVWAVTRRGDLLLLHRERERWDDPGAIKAARRIHERWRILYFCVESNGVGASRAQNMRAAGLPVKEVFAHTDKIARSTTAVVRCEAGQVFWPLDAPWLSEWENEHLDFPDAKHDDQVDTTSLAAIETYEALALGVGPLEVVSPSEEDQPRGTDRWDALGRSHRNRFRP